VGVEIANLGAYPTTAPGPLKEWYQKDAQGRTFIAVPARFGANLDYAPGFVARPVRRGPVVGTVQGRVLEQYDLTRQQYAALTQLTAALCAVFPKIRCAVPRDASGHPLDHKLPEDQLQNYHGILGHFQLQVNKLDPGPAFQWDYVIDESRRLLGVRYPIPPRLISDNK